MLQLPHQKCRLSLCTQILGGAMVSLDKSWRYPLSFLNRGDMTILRGQMMVSRTRSWCSSRETNERKFNFKLPNECWKTFF